MSGEEKFLSGQVALVTGAGRGIGRAIAASLAAHGAEVIVCGRTERELTDAASALGGRAVVLDVADRDAIAAAAPSFGTVDILVNNAGIAESAPFERTSDALWDRAFAVNVTGAFALIRAVLPGMLARGRGRVINVASNAGLTGYAYTAAYCASKHAMVGMTRALAVEVARSGVTVNAVCPGWVNTRMTDEAVERIAKTTGRSAEAARKSLEAMSPQRRLMECDEVAHAVLALCAHGARGIHGQSVVVDGGQVMS